MPHSQRHFCIIPSILRITIFRPHKNLIIRDSCSWGDHIFEKHKISFRSEFSDLRHETSSATYSHFADDASPRNDYHVQDGCVPCDHDKAQPSQGDMRLAGTARPTRGAMERDHPVAATETERGYSEPPGRRLSQLIMHMVFPVDAESSGTEITKRIHSRLRMDALFCKTYQ